MYLNINIYNFIKTAEYMKKMIGTGSFRKNFKNYSGVLCSSVDSEPVSGSNGHWFKSYNNSIRIQIAVQKLQKDLLTRNLKIRNTLIKSHLGQQFRPIPRHQMRIS